MFEKKSLLKRREDPFNLLRQMAGELDRMFDEPWSSFQFPVPNIAADWAPKVDVVTQDNNLVTRVDLPGMKKEDVNVEVADGLLTLSGERKKEVKEEKGDYFREEREYGSFCRTVPLPAAAVASTPTKIAIADGGAATKAA